MVYLVPCTTPATPALPLAPRPTGQPMVLDWPYVLFHPALSWLRYPEKTNVVPELSDLCTTRMLFDGRVMLVFRDCISGSFQLVTLPEKMSATTLPVRCRFDLIPGRL